MKKTQLKTDPSAAAPPRIRQPRQRRSQESLDALLQAAEMEIARSGVDGLTIADLLRRAGMSNGAFYLRFQNKDALIAETQDRFLTRVESQLESDFQALAQERLDFDATLTRAATAIVAVFRENAKLIEGFVRHAPRDSGLGMRANQAASFVRNLFGTAMSRHRAAIRHPDPDRAILMAYETIVAVVIERVSNPQGGLAQKPLDWTGLDIEIPRLLRAYLAS